VCASLLDYESPGHSLYFLGFDDAIGNLPGRYAPPERRLVLTRGSNPGW
jgi:hypothetical protein